MHIGSNIFKGSEDMRNIQEYSERVEWRNIQE